jgi:hypothetical protein
MWLVGGYFGRLVKSRPEGHEHGISNGNVIYTALFLETLEDDKSSKENILVSKPKISITSNLQDDYSHYMFENTYFRKTSDSIT